MHEVLEVNGLNLVEMEGEKQGRDKELATGLGEVIGSPTNTLQGLGPSCDLLKSSGMNLIEMDGATVGSKFMISLPLGRVRTIFLGVGNGALDGGEYAESLQTGRKHGQGCREVDYECKSTIGVHHNNIHEFKRSFEEPLQRPSDDIDTMNRISV
ncbi:dissimilatory sulfite reductase alpha subunit [Sesbania bispinosa]|nr:dissimilatory sulfite reductase alpha subunit [Sesbania bispinosa]